MDGSGTGANSGEWLVGSGFAPGLSEAKNVCGSFTPMKKNIDGMPASTNAEKSSLAVIGGTRSTRSLPKAVLNIASVRATTVGSLLTALPPSVILISASGAPDISVTALAVRRMPSSIFWRTAGLYERIVPRSSTLSGMMFSALPPWIAPMLTTPNSCGSFSRLITLCRSTTKRAAIITGSMVLSGAEPWPPRPLKVISSPSELDVIGPLLNTIEPYGPGPVCNANA